MECIQRKTNHLSNSNLQWTKENWVGSNLLFQHTTPHLYLHIFLYLPSLYPLATKKECSFSEIKENFSDGLARGKILYLYLCLCSKESGLYWHKPLNWLHLNVRCKTRRTGDNRDRQCSRWPVCLRNYLQNWGVTRGCQALRRCKCNKGT